MGKPVKTPPVCFAPFCLRFVSCTPESVLFFAALAAGFAASWAGFAPGSGFMTSCEAAATTSTLMPAQHSEAVLDNTY